MPQSSARQGRMSLPFFSRAMRQVRAMSRTNPIADWRRSGRVSFPVAFSYPV
jgi:hypothetical protein